MKIAILAGRGRLPALLVEALRGDGHDPLVCALAGQLPDLVPRQGIWEFQIEHLGTLLADLSGQGVTHLCLAGAVTRPRIDENKVDAATRPLVGRVSSAMAMGDDGTLRALLTLLEEAGFGILSADDILPGLLPPPGVLTRAVPPDTGEADARAGEAEVARLGQADAGQACLIKQGQVIAREGPDGTDAMLARCAIPGAVLFKAPKPDQDRRADLPAIGPGTAHAAARSGLAGIMVEAGGVMVMDRNEVVELLDDAGIYLWVRPPEDRQ